jgi:hypothetical protein
MMLTCCSELVELAITRDLAVRHTRASVYVLERESKPFCSDPLWRAAVNVLDRMHGAVKSSHLQSQAQRRGR